MRYKARLLCEAEQGICFSYDNFMEWKYDYEPYEFNIKVYATSGGERCGMFDIKANI